MILERKKFNRVKTLRRHSWWFAMALMATLALPRRSIAIPSFSLLTGTRCSACHFDPQGSGIRTELGWEMMSQTGLFHWNGVDTSGIPLTNTIFNGMLIPGGDARFQLVRYSKTNQELLIPMQLTTSLAVMPIQQLSVYTDINWASIYVRAVTAPTDLFGTASGLYPGETDYDLTLQYQPGITLPSIRVGMIEPSIGIRQDDHTAFTSMDAVGSSNNSYSSITLIPPYYNEIGGELTYEGIRWLTINAGIFNAYNLSQIDPTIGTVNSNFDFRHPTVSGRIVLWPQLIDDGLNFETGASILQNGSFRMFDGFGGIGLADKATFFVEGLYAKDASDKIVRNFSVIGTLRLTDWLMPEWRYDWGMTEVYPGQSLGWASGFLFGVEFFPWPYIELRPEYRVTDMTPFSTTGTNPGSHTGQWTAQLHVFY